MTKNLYVDIHVLQTVPSSNINRDDTGAPKTAIYGGVTRSRVSSQSWKRAIRHEFNESGTQVQGIRTKEVAQLLANSLQAKDDSLNQDTAEARAEEILKAASIKVKNGQTGALMLVSQGQVEKIAEYALSHDNLDKKELKAVFNGNQSLDLALFGRMVADNPELNVEASAQVAHAISTHAVEPEFDYYTALDDLQGEDTSGAAMLGTVEYNSSTLYRYANVNANELVQNLGADDAAKGIREFIKTFTLSMPTGKQNTFANKTLPSYVMVTLRDDTPVNLVSAFEEPVKSNDGYIKKSVAQLEIELTKADRMVDQPVLTVVLSQEGSELDNQAANINDLLDQVTSKLSEVIADEDVND